MDKVLYRFDKKSAVKLCMLLIIALVSIFGFSKHFSKPESYKKTIRSLDEKKMTVAKLTAASSGASAAITLLPGDAGTPIADKLVDLSGYFIIILSAIYLEKVLTTVTGFLTFAWIIPLGCLVLGAGIIMNKEGWKRAAYRIAAFGFVLFLLVPSSIFISEKIEKTHEFSVRQTIDDANAAAREIEENSDEEDENVINKFLDKVSNGIQGQLEKFQALLSSFIDTIAMLIVTTCIIPVGVFLILIVLARQLLGLRSMPDPGRDNPSLSGS